MDNPGLSNMVKCCTQRIHLLALTDRIWVAWPFQRTPNGISVARYEHADGGCPRP